MARFRVMYGEWFEYDGEADGVVGQLRARHRSPDFSEEKFRRRLAIELVEWAGGHFYFGDNGALADSMIEAGLLVELPAG